jgi:hypothetical protein
LKAPGAIDGQVRGNKISCICNKSALGEKDL